MLVKRLYDIPEGWEPQRDAHGVVHNQPPPQDRVLLKHTGTNPEQNFSRRFVDGGLQEGWLSLGRGKLTMATVTQDGENVDLEYTVLKQPGTYCCHCEAKLDDDPSGASNRQHVTDLHGEAESPDPTNPAGYRITNAYECVLDEGQHARWAVPEYATVSHARWKEGQQEQQGTNGTEEVAQSRAQRKRGGRAVEPEATDTEEGEEA